MSEERLAGIETKVDQLAGMVTVVMEVVNNFMDNILTPNRGRPSPNRGRGRGRGFATAGRGQAQDEDELSELDDSTATRENNNNTTRDHDKNIKLCLPTLDHPQPYKLRWLNKGAEVRVDKQYLFPFFIGKEYSDEVMCDVLPMDACHLLLGRPWEFYRDCFHRERENTYSFKLGKNKITFTHLPPALNYTAPPSLVEHSKEVLMIGEIEMIQELNSREIVFILLAKGIAKEAGLPLPTEIKHLLKKYGDVFPDELPSGLPPPRGIEHHIDLIPGVVLPNKAAYRNDPRATQELQKQSRCAVSALLVPKKDGTWRMCTDSRAINNITVKYRFPIPRLDDIIDELSRASIFSKIDLRQDYHQVRIREGDEWKTTFKTKHGMYEWLIMPFGLSNALSTFMRLMTEVLRAHLG
ncbi:uncharacterized protein LOC141649697 [Silene latifolia]|uniref:uncharacterized protein LOC141649697 n=1 Tax=Silene latifolia TaxID=37657 RepID=UPI003D78AC57